MLNIRKQKMEVNNSLLNIITPMGLELKSNSLVIGENTGKIYGVVKYPQKVDYGWLARITNIPNTVVTIAFKPIDNGSFMDNLSKNIMNQRSLADTAKDPLTQKRAEKAAEDGENIMVQIDRAGETVGMLSISIMPVSKKISTFDKIRRKTESTASMIGCKLRNLANLQKEGLLAISPFYTMQEEIEQVLSRIIPLSTFVGGFPFSSNGYNDNEGYYLGKDSSGGLIIVNPWRRGDDRTNSNMVIMGVPGTGKSTAIKSIALSEYMTGTKLIFLDPESEYKEITKKLDGDFINAGGGKGGRINPLQIRPVPKDDEKDEERLYIDEGNGMGDMALYLKNLEIFFGLYIPSLTDMQKAILKDELIELYNKFNIDWDTDTSTLKNEEFPIMSDLYESISEKAKAHKDNENNIYVQLSILLKDIAMGSDSFLWNGHSTIRAESNCICLDTHHLQDSSDNIKRAQYFLLLNWCWQEMSRDRNEKVLLIADEAYLLIDPKVPQSLIFLRNVEKRSRKYEAAVGIISHSVVDFLSPEIKMYGQAVLDVPCIKLMFGTDGTNLQETKELYKLTEAEEELLISKKRGRALLLIGSKRLQVNFDIPKYKFEYMGEAGGR